MRKPEESLEDFTVKAMAIEKASEPARAASLRFTGRVEVLKPLTPRLGNPAAAAGDKFFYRPTRYQFSWFQGVLGAAGAVAVMALILLSAIFIGIYDPPAGPGVGSIDIAGNPSDAAIDQQLEDGPVRTEEAINPDILMAENSSYPGDELPPIRSTAKPVSESARVQISANRPRRQPRRPQLVMTKFVPTTLVIFAENGEIKTRIEPQLAAVYHKPLTITN